MIRLRQQAMNALVNPHFIFNSLNSIQHFMNMNDTLSANRYLTRFARLIRKTMDSSRQMFVTLEDELERLELYLSLEKMRLGSKLSFSVETVKIDDKKRVRIPSMLTQPYVENAIWHGVMPLKEGGMVKISFRREDTLLKIEIEDNGAGIKPAKEPGKDKALRGMQINRERLRILDPHRSYIRIINLEESGEGHGTRIEIQMSYITGKKTAKTL
jgi:LytS/YehU family sensor histidine kinase